MEGIKTMRTKGDRAVKLFKDCLDVFAKKYNFYPKGINMGNLHAVFSDDRTFRGGNTYALKVIMNEMTNQIEMYLAIANSITHESLSRIKNVATLCKQVDRSIKMRTEVNKFLLESRK
jgi:hypothetical protein